DSIAQPHLDRDAIQPAQNLLDLPTSQCRIMPFGSRYDVLSLPRVFKSQSKNELLLSQQSSQALLLNHVADALRWTHANLQNAGKIQAMAESVGVQVRLIFVTLKQLLDNLF